jgi:peptidoglycan-associated lipoprotein
MNKVSKKLFLVIASAALVLAGCTKKPKRPDPSQTLGTQAGTGTGGDSVNAKDINTGPDTTVLPPQDQFDLNGQKRGVLESVFFDFDSPGIKQSERVKLQAAKDYLDKNPDQRLLIEGHCDWRGTAEYNLGLGDRRANAAKKYLISLGVSADKIETLSKGSLDAVKNGDETKMGNDRRDELVPLKKQGDAAPATGTTPAPAPVATK